MKLASTTRAIGVAGLAVSFMDGSREFPFACQMMFGPPSSCRAGLFERLRKYDISRRSHRKKIQETTKITKNTKEETGFGKTIWIAIPPAEGFSWSPHFPGIFL